MTETKKRPKRFILRRLVVAALVMALAFALAMGANAATDGELFKNVLTFVSYSEDGSTITMRVDAAALENTSEDEPVHYTVKGFGNDKGALFYKDKDGNYVSEEFDLTEAIGEALDGTPQPDVETETPSGVEAPAK